MDIPNKNYKGLIVFEAKDGEVRYSTIESVDFYEEFCYHLASSPTKVHQIISRLTGPPSHWREFPLSDNIKPEGPSLFSQEKELPDFLLKIPGKRDSLAAIVIYYSETTHELRLSKSVKFEDI